MQTAYEFFGARVQAYDALIRRAVPRYDEMLERTIEYLPPRAQRVLELGCGTGNLTAALAERYPDARFVLVDGSEEMLATARARLGADRDVACVRARFEDLDLAPEFDVVTSSIALHHVHDKAALFRRVRAAAAPGARLVVADQMRGATDAHHEQNLAAMRAHWRGPGGFDEDWVRELEEHAEQHDVYEPVPLHLRLLEAAGFRDADCVWRNWLWAIVTASG